MNPLIRLSQEVKEALDHHQPVVALESTIISHGMPYPQNVEMARKTEQIIREHGAVPATIALMDGKIQVGLDDQQLELLATARMLPKYLVVILQKFWLVNKLSYDSGFNHDCG